MQVIILAAGMGKRLGELTQNNTKCMIRVNGVTLIERVLDQFSKLKLNKVIMVIGCFVVLLVIHIRGYRLNTLQIRFMIKQIISIHCL